MGGLAYRQSTRNTDRPGGRVTPLVLLTVLLAGAAGAVLRFLAARLLATRSRFPFAVLLVNVIGSAIGGAVLALAERGGVGADVRLVLLTGLCGGLTTFSTFSVETVQLVEQGRAKLAFLNVSSNLVLGLAAAAGAYLLLR
jgi:fluoride exporter